ncbi:NucA/NucB deoxyribonuclease domain-containing protein [Streptomyces coriariae]|uniref:NucA/NucB deoxyribonuclease domain-containing protein n=1 Tax=Streptomyces coriariae TaxID=2864460 RepID=UPI001E36A32A|nr:hypothetical protein [Streptomyces coriariae]
MSAFLAVLAGGVTPAEAGIPSATEIPIAGEVPTLDSPALAPEITPGSDQPLMKPESEVVGTTLAATESENCGTPTTEGEFSCFQVTSPGKQSALSSGTTSASVSPPQWCEESTGTPLGTRTQVCQTNAGIYTTYKKVDGVVSISGQAKLLIINYSYTDTGLGTFAHQIETSAYQGWGEALKATISGKATRNGQCKVQSSSFPSKPLSPLNSWQVGESFFDTTAVNDGDIGTCATKWTITILNGSQLPVNAVYELNEIRCDNATPGRPKVGCVVPWFPSLLSYSAARAPGLVRHVTLAQQSGLPGATFEKPLRRTTDSALIGRNRLMACGDAPSIQGKSCDEYPFASTKNGLATGGNRRTFDDCDLPSIPSGTGASGVSVCMVPKEDQDYQGGTNTQFYRSERVINKDPFRVGFTA